MSTDTQLLEQLIRPIVERILAEHAPATPSPQSYMSVKQAAVESGIREQTIRKWISQKRVPVYRATGRAVRVRLCDILKEEV